jgi:NitT/TauT family transport system permease protein
MKKALPVLYSFLALALVWQTAFLLVGKEIIIPNPVATLTLMIRFVVSGKVLLPIWQTTWKATAALFFSMAIGIPIGFFLGRSVFWYRFFRPWIMVIQAVPVVSWLTLVIFTWGLGWKGPVFISTVSLLPMSILTTISGVQKLDIQLLEMAYFYRTPFQKILGDIYLGSLFPFIVAIFDVNIGQAWKVILVTEYLCGGDGLGEQILTTRMNVDTAGAWALTLVAVSLGIATETLSKRILRETFTDGILPQDDRTFKVF